MPQLKTIFVLLVVAGVLTVPSQCVGQIKSQIPTPAELKDQTKAIRTSHWFPKRTSNRLQKVADAIALFERADKEPNPAAHYAILNEALLLSDANRQWSLSREILESINTYFVLQPDLLSDWYDKATGKKQPLVRITELIRLFSTDVAKNDLPGQIKSWQSNAKQLHRKIGKSKAPFAIRWCVPQLTQASHRLAWRASNATPLQQAVSAIVDLQDIPAGIQLLSTCDNLPVQTAAKDLLAQQDDFAAYLALLDALSNDGDPNLHLAAASMFQSKLKQWSTKEIARAQSTCFALARQRPTGDFSFLINGPKEDQDSFVLIRPKRIADRDNLLFDPDTSSWKATDKFKIGYPSIPLVNFVHDIEFIVYSMKSTIQFKYGTHFHNRLYFKPQDQGEIRLLHCSASGGRFWWNGGKTYKIGQKIRFKLYSICGEQFLTTDGRLVSRRSAPAQWLRHDLNSNGQSEIEINLSTLRPWLPGDDRLFELAVDQPVLLNCVREPKISFGREDLKAVIGNSASLKTKPVEKTEFVNGSEIVMQPISKGEFQRDKTKVKLSADFWCARYEITQLQWEKITKQNPSSIQGNSYFPVDNVSYQQIAEFCRKLTASESKAKRLPDGYVYRLPTENEWEYVARAGNNKSFSVDQNDFWHRGTSASHYHAVGTSKPNKWGVFDMHGNVDEFVFDEHHDSPATPAPVESDPVAVPSSDKVRVVCRGGSWHSLADHCNSSKRSAQTTEAAPYRGFRVVLAPAIARHNGNKFLCSTSRKRCPLHLSPLAGDNLGHGK